MLFLSVQHGSRSLWYQTGFGCGLGGADPGHSTPQRGVHGAVLRKVSELPRCLAVQLLLGFYDLSHGPLKTALLFSQRAGDECQLYHSPCDQVLNSSASMFSAQWDSKNTYPVLMNRMKESNGLIYGKN